jgi:hypothetical protein
MEHQISVRQWPRKSLFAIHHTLGVGHFLHPLEVVKLWHELVQHFEIIIATERMSEGCLDDAVREHTAIDVAILLLVEHSLIRLVVVFNPAFSLLIEVAYLVIEIFE